MDGPRLKLQRLERFRRQVPHVSASALSAILSKVDRDGIPDGHGRKSFAAARDATINSTTPYGSLLQTVTVAHIDDTASQLLYCHPFAMLWHAMKTCGTFSTFFMSRMAKFPPSPEQPWRLVLYSDEVTPGNVLAHVIRRKCQAIYWTFLEFGSAALCREDSWFCFTVKRSSEVNLWQGGLAQLMGITMKAFFPPIGECSSLAHGGITLKPCGASAMVRLFAKLGPVIQDGDAHRATWHARGSNGTKLCILCLNVFAAESELVEEDGTQCLRANVVYEHQCHFATSDDIIGAFKRLSAHQQADAVGVFTMRQQAMGLTWHPYSILLDPVLCGIVQPAEQFMHDWMHCLVASGIFQYTLHLLLKALMTSGMHDVYAVFQGYVALYKYPRGFSNKTLSHLFEPKRRDGNRDAGKFKCQASDALGLYPVLAHFLHATVVPHGDCIRECLAFLALCDLLDACTATPRGNVTPQIMRDRVHAFLKAFVAAWSKDHLFPKCHWLLHFPRHIQQWGTLLSCFVTERKHKMVKKYANDVDNTMKYEASVLSEVTCHHLSTLSEDDTFSFSIGLVHPRPAPKALAAWLREQLDTPDAQIQSSSVCRFSAFGTCHKKDVVLVNIDGTIQAGEVWAHADIYGTAITIISLWTMVRRNELAAEWRVVQNPQIYESSDILDVCSWAYTGPDIVRTLWPASIKLGG